MFIKYDDEGHVERIEELWNSSRQAEKQWPTSPPGVLSALGSFIK